MKRHQSNEGNTPHAGSAAAVAAAGIDGGRAVDRISLPSAFVSGSR